MADEFKVGNEQYNTQDVDQSSIIDMTDQEVDAFADAISTLMENKKKAADASKALPIEVLNQDGEETVSTWLDTRRIGLNNKMVGVAKDNEETFLGEVANQAMLGARTIEKGLEFISGSSSRDSPNRGLKKAINIGIQQALDEEKE